MNFKEEYVSLLQDLVRIPSINPPGKEEAVTRYLVSYLRRNGLDPIEVPTADPRRRNIVCTLKGETDEDAIVFTGHQDVVGISEAETPLWITDPFGAQIIDGRLYGRGSSDMKSGVAAMVMAMVLLKRQDVRPHRDVILAITCDEENLMSGSKALIRTNYFSRAKAVIVCEPTGLKVCRVGKGRTFGSITVFGKAAHGSKQGVGQNAVDLAVDLITLVNQTDFSAFDHPDYGSTFWRVLAIHAGMEPQVVPNECRMTLDARLSVKHHPDQVWHTFDELLSVFRERHPDARVTYEIIDERAPFIIPEDAPIVAEVRAAFEAARIPYAEDFFTGTTDGTQFKKIGIDPIILGPGDLSVVHRENEFVAIDEALSAVELYMALMR